MIHDTLERPLYASRPVWCILLLLQRWGIMDLRHITHKKLGMRLTDAEIAYFADAAAIWTVGWSVVGAVDGDPPQRHGRGRNRVPTMAMAQTGHMLQPDAGGVPVDKHPPEWGIRPR